VTENEGAEVSIWTPERGSDGEAEVHEKLRKSYSSNVIDTMRKTCAVNVTCLGELSIAYRSGHKPEMRGALGRPRHRCEDNVMEETGCYDVERICLLQVRYY
jgi:hypothetical protein